MHGGIRCSGETISVLTCAGDASDYAPAGRDSTSSTNDRGCVLSPSIHRSERGAPSEWTQPGAAGPLQQRRRLDLRTTGHRRVTVDGVAHYATGIERGATPLVG